MSGIGKWKCLESLFCSGETSDEESRRQRKEEELKERNYYYNQGVDGIVKEREEK